MMPCILSVALSNTKLHVMHVTQYIQYIFVYDAAVDAEDGVTLLWVGLGWVGFGCSVTWFPENQGKKVRQ